MLEGVRRIVAEDRPHAGIELVLSVQEEIGLLGVKALDCSQLAARIGYVYDHAAPIGGLVTACPSQYSIDATFLGRSAHAGIAPEEGRNAIAAAAHALAEMRFGRLDDETTANVGTISGGIARNIVRRPLRRAARGALARSRARAQGEPGRCSMRSRTRPTPPSASSRRPRRSSTGPTSCAAPIPSCRSPGRRSRAAATRPSLLATGGGADAHVFNERGIPA